jgi:hypothetical protein
VNERKFNFFSHFERKTFLIQPIILLTLTFSYSFNLKMSHKRFSILFLVFFNVMVVQVKTDQKQQVRRKYLKLRQKLNILIFLAFLVFYYINLKPVKTNSVTTNSSGPGIFVSYNRDSLLTDLFVY